MPARAQRRLPLACVFLYLAVTLFSFFLSGEAAHAMGGKPHQFSVGMQTFGVWEPEQGERFDFAVFYPTIVSERELVREGWEVRAYEGARITPGFYPVILLSHDTASSRFANSDLASVLAGNGFVVIAPTHSGDNQSDSSGLYSVGLMASRPRQLLIALDKVLAEAMFAPYVDESRIGLLGVGFGAVSVLQTVGARPEFSRMEEYCDSGLLGPLAQREPFCTAWVSTRMRKLGPAMLAVEAEHGPSAFTPPVGLFAPELKSVPVIVADSVVRQNVASGKKSLWQRLFGSADEEAPLAQDAEKAKAANATQDAQAVEGPRLVIDFDGGPLFDGEGSSFVYLALSDSPQFRVAVDNDTSPELTPPVMQQEKTQKPPVYRRPASSRKIQAITFVAPAGGMLFSVESLSGVHLPVLIVEAGDDGLYAPCRHSRPYFSLFPARPQLLRLTGVDHFSLFAVCSREVREKLYDTCGKLVEAERESVYLLRDEVVVDFFRSVLGTPETPPPPSGFVARAAPEAEKRTPQESR